MPSLASNKRPFHGVASATWLQLRGAGVSFPVLGGIQGSPNEGVGGLANARSEGCLTPKKAFAPCAVGLS